MPQPPNMQQMLKQVQKMQQDMAAAQEALKNERVEASAGGGMVRVVVTGVTNPSPFSNAFVVSTTSDTGLAGGGGVAPPPSPSAPKIPAVAAPAPKSPTTATVSGTGRDFVTLSVTKNGSTGGGTVTGDAINCGTTCSEQVARTSTTDPVIVLTAMPDATSTRMKPLAKRFQ